MTLTDAAHCLDEIAAGRMLDQKRVIATAIALHKLQLPELAGRKLLETINELTAIAKGRPLYPAATGRARPDQLAAAIRKEIARGGRR